METPNETAGKTLTSIFKELPKAEQFKAFVFLIISITVGILGYKYLGNAEITQEQIDQAKTEQYKKDNSFCDLRLAYQDSINKKFYEALLADLTNMKPDIYLRTETQKTKEIHKVDECGNSETIVVDSKAPDQVNRSYIPSKGKDQIIDKLENKIDSLNKKY